MKSAACRRRLVPSVAVVLFFDVRVVEKREHQFQQFLENDDDIVVSGLLFLLQVDLLFSQRAPHLDGESDHFVGVFGHDLEGELLDCVHVVVHMRVVESHYFG